MNSLFLSEFLTFCNVSNDIPAITDIKIFKGSPIVPVYNSATTFGKY